MPDIEELLLTSEEAEAKAESFGRFDEDGNFDPTKEPEIDPFREGENRVESALLTADDIKKYVLRTGMIAPFYGGGGGNSRMKDASYEGRIGSAAYRYEADKVEPTKIFQNGDRKLMIPANSIVFVESDLYFRIPDFIALRFNLQIKHVHRGLLLGTGPLVDPGYWGKLCIPLHNLTDEDYEIPAEEGLIWIEFTKTTKISDRIGRPPLRKKFPNIEDFLDKASRNFDRPNCKVGIRSAIPGAVEDAKQQAKDAAESASRSYNLLKGFGYAGALATAAALFALFQSTLSISNSYRTDTNSKFEKLNPVVEQLKTDVNALSNGTLSKLSAFSALEKKTVELDRMVAELTSQLMSELSDRRQLEASLSKRELEITLLREELSQLKVEICARAPEEERAKFCTN